MYEIVTGNADIVTGTVGAVATCALESLLLAFIGDVTVLDVGYENITAIAEHR